MDLLIPDSGLLFWMTLVFIIVFIILWKAGFPAIIKMVNGRKAFIDESLASVHHLNDGWESSLPKNDEDDDEDQRHPEEQTAIRN